MKLARRILTYLLTLLLTLSGFSFSRPRRNADFPKAAVEAKTLLPVYGEGGARGLTLSALQGLLANKSDRNLLIRAGNYEKWLPYTDARLVPAQPDGTPWNFDALLREFAPLLDGYILCDEQSANIALSIAKQKNSVPVLPECEEAVKAAGLVMTADVRGMSDLRFRMTPEFKALRRDVAFEQPADSAPRLIDYAAMCGAYMQFDAEAIRAEHTNA